MIIKYIHSIRREILYTELYAFLLSSLHFFFFHLCNNYRNLSEKGLCWFLLFFFFQETYPSWQGSHDYWRSSTHSRRSLRWKPSHTDGSGNRVGQRVRPVYNPWGPSLLQPSRSRALQPPTHCQHLGNQPLETWDCVGGAFPFQMITAFQLVDVELIVFS